MLAQPKRDLIKQGKFDEVLSGMKRQNEREDWSKGESGSELNTQDQLNEFKKGRIYSVPDAGNTTANNLISKYMLNKGQGMFADTDLVVKLQREGKLSKEKAEDILQKLKQELNPKSTLELNFYD